ncbi:MAG: N-6 DNA methylase [Sandaracinaceae bacterium]|nr:N-6 DNA methylase [Sandaracinaceae bacterium]
MRPESHGPGHALNPRSERLLLDGLDPARISPGATSLESCLDRKTRAIATFDWLDETFNGGLLPLSRPPRELRAEFFDHVVGNIAHGATAEGQLPLRLPTRWQEVNFPHVPVGLLSEVYEAHAHDVDSARATRESIFYTPRQLAELVVREALEALGDVEQPRVLDPAAGAGVFLVAAFRALVAREWARTGAAPSRKVVRRILEHQLVGFDINDSALRLAQLALYLTAIELDPEEKPRPLALLRFADTSKRTLVPQPGGVDSGSLAAVEDRFRGRFDLVVGNPPWTRTLNRDAARRWTEETRAIVAERLGEERARAFTFPRTTPDLPFLYRAMEWAKPGGSVALITHARWLFNQSEVAKRARLDLFEALHVTGILNGTALRDTGVWPNVRHAFAVCFAVNEPAPEGAPFQFISPHLDAFPDSTQDRFRIDWRDAQPIEPREVIERPWTLKARFRGTLFDERVVDALFRSGEPLGAYLARLGTRLRNGYQRGGEATEKRRPPREMYALHDLHGHDLEFLLRVERLPPFRWKELLRPRAPGIYRGPLLLIHESMRADRLAPRAGLVLGGVAFDERFDGASFADVPDGADIARYLQLVLQSAAFAHALLMLDGQLGIEREVVHLETIESVPVVPWDSLGSEQQKRSAMLSRSLHANPSAAVLEEIDEYIADVYGLTAVSRRAIGDTLETMLPTAASKERSVSTTSEDERRLFAATCEAEMREILSASNVTASVRVRGDLDRGPWRLLQVDRGAHRSTPPLPIERLLEAAHDGAATMAQVHLDAGTSLVAVLDRYRLWTPTQARLLASTLISEDV